MSDVLLVQNTRIEGSGHLGQLLSDDGFDILSVHAKHEKILLLLISDQTRSLIS